MSRLLSRTSLLLGITVLAAPSFLSAQAAITPPACLSGTTQSFSATGTLQTYNVPPGALDLLVMADGASGGDNTQVGAGVIQAAGHGAHLLAGVPSLGVTQLSVVVGQKGADADSAAAGGGGGSFAYVTATNALLVAAGGGGGAGGTEAGSDASLGESGVDGSNPSGLGGANGLGGEGVAGGGGGGGGFLGAGSTGTTPLGGGGGDQVSPPGTAAGGAGCGAIGNGGYGGGGGACGPGGAGGGGYSGGGGGLGPGVDGGGGGGSYVVSGGTTYEASILGATGDGQVTICVTRASVTAIPTLSPSVLALLALGLLLAGGALLRRSV